MAAPTFESFEEFWPYYVRQHSKKATRWLHFGATAAGLLALGVGLARKRSRWLIAIAPVLGLAPAWASHWLIEKNDFTILQHPIWSARANLLMMAKMITGQMDAEVERLLGETGPWDTEQEEDGPPSGVRVEIHEFVDLCDDSEPDPHSVN